MRAFPKRLRLLRSAALAAALIAAACSDSDTAIFYYLEKEEPVVDYSLDNQTTIKGMAHAGGRYFVSVGGSIWQRPDGGTDWVKVNKPPGADYLGPLVEFGGELYVSVNDGSGEGLYTASAAGAPAWTLVTDDDVSGAGKQVTGLFVAGPAGTPELFVSVMQPNGSYTLVHSSDGSTFAPTTITGKPRPVTQVAYDSVAAYYYAAVGEQLLRGADSATFNFDATPAAASGGRIEGVYYSAAPRDTVYAATDADFVDGPDDGGRILSTTDDGLSWQDSGEVSDSGDVRFLRIGEAGGNILIGTMEHGLYRIPPAGSVADHDRLPETSDNELYGGTVLGFFVPAAGTSVFALTAGSGLWRADSSLPFASWEWVRE